MIITQFCSILIKLSCRLGETFSPKVSEAKHCTVHWAADTFLLKLGPVVRDTGMN